MALFMGGGPHLSTWMKSKNQCFQVFLQSFFGNKSHLIFRQAKTVENLHPLSVHCFFFFILEKKKKELAPITCMSDAGAGQCS